MSIIYALVARGTIILAEYTNSSGNFTTVTEAILEKIPPNNSKLTYVYDRQVSPLDLSLSFLQNRYLFHYIRNDGLTYLCMADDTFGRRIPFAFLLDLKTRFLSQYSQERAMSAMVPYGMNEFSKTIAKQMEYFSTNPEADRIKQVQGEIEQVKDVMVHNIERVLERGERIELLVDKTDNLNQQAFAFKKRSTALKRTMWWKNTKLTVILTAVVIFLIYLIICSACGFPFWSSCRS
ncbi:MAG: vesicle-associated membrane protein [Linnemannia gamsii]|nr:MAG: vesicle-associated membrane protein [Linnemannia gamsii]